MGTQCRTTTHETSSKPCPASQFVVDVLDGLIPGSSEHKASTLERVHEIAGLRLGRVNLSRVPPNRLAALARQGLGSKAPTLARMPEPKRTAMLTAVVRHLEAAAIDDALDLFALLMQVRLISTARRATERERLARLPRWENASRTLAKASRDLIEEMELVDACRADLDVAALWRAVETVASREEVRHALTRVEELVPPDGEAAEAAMPRPARTPGDIPLSPRCTTASMTSVNAQRQPLFHRSPRPVPHRERRATALPTPQSEPSLATWRRSHPDAPALGRPVTRLRSPHQAVGGTGVVPTVPGVATPCAGHRLAA